MCVADFDNYHNALQNAKCELGEFSSVFSSECCSHTRNSAPQFTNTLLRWFYHVKIGDESVGVGCGVVGVSLTMYSVE